MKMTFSERVYYVCELIPPGKVATYGQIAIMIGYPRASRQVGGALHRSPEGRAIPAHRVVNRHGELTGAQAFTLATEQANRLRAEGISVVENKVALDVYGWKPDYQELQAIAGGFSKD